MQIVVIGNVVIVIVNEIVFQLIFQPITKLPIFVGKGAFEKVELILWGRVQWVDASVKNSW